MSVEPAMTWEQAVLQFRALPANAEMARACFYDDPLPAAARRYADSAEWVAVRSWLKARRGNALDLGAGRGISAYALARDGWTVTAIEPDPSDIVGAGAIRRLAIETGTAITVVQQPAETLPFDNGSFDLVHCRAVLHHAADLGRMCREAARVLGPGGRFVALREHVISRQEDLPVFLDSHPLHRLYGGERAYLLREYVAAIESAGLTLRQVVSPWANDANTFPETVDDIRARLARRIHWPWPAMIPLGLVTWLGTRLQAPGRLYSFVAEKPAHG